MNEQATAAITDDENTVTREQLLSSVKQLNQVLTIIGKLAVRIQQEVEAMPVSSDTPHNATSSTTPKKETLLH